MYYVQVHAQSRTHERTVLDALAEEIGEGRIEDQWFDCRSELALHARASSVSRRYPGALIVVDRDTDDETDQRAWFRDGMSYRVERPEWEPPAFDPARLAPFGSDGPALVRDDG